MILHEYATRAEYVDAQVEGNAKKIRKVWAIQTNVQFIAENVIPFGARFGICHGARNGAEVTWFSQHLPRCKVIGTDIGPTARKFDGMICWDFHMPKKAWTGKASFVYSNSLDHARDPKRAVKTWYDQLAPGGVLIIEHSNYHEQVSGYNCFAAETKELQVLIMHWTGRKVRVIPLPDKLARVQHLEVLIVRKR